MKKHGIPIDGEGVAEGGTTKFFYRSSETVIGLIFSEIYPEEGR